MTSTGISVVMCIRNGETYLRDALDSVAAQRGIGRLDVVVVDDGSTDRSAQIAETHLCRPRVVRQQASGQPAALNRGVAVVRTDYLAFIDCDDIWPDGRLQALHAPVMTDPACDGAFGRMSNTDAGLKPAGPAFLTRMHTAGLFRRSLLARIGPFRTDVRHASNVDWISRAAAAHAKFATVDAVVLLRRIHGGNMGVVDVMKGRQDMLRVIRDHHTRTRK